MQQIFRAPDRGSACAPRAPDKLPALSPHQEAPLAETFDVFFSYNSKDRDAVRTVRTALESRSVSVWMDERQIRGGARWMEELQEIIVTARSAAIFLGKDGLGRWQKLEVEACIHQNTEREMPVITVPLPGLPDGFKVPIFLKSFSWIDLRAGLSEDFLEQLTRSIPKEESGPDQKETPSRPSHGPRHHNLPFLPLGDLLKGRDEELRTLETNLQGTTAATAITQTQAIHGLGGIGKTRLAVEYAWRSGDRYDAALFLVAESPEALQSGLAGLTRLGLPGLAPVASRAQEEQVTAVLAWLREHDRWLLILDNVDSPEAAEAIRKILPQLQGGHLLITSRRSNWPASIHSQSLDKLRSEEATQFLLQRTQERRSRAADDGETACRLVTILDGLPLALEQAAAYIARHQITFSKYLEIWEKERGTVLDWRDEDQMEYPASVAVTWQTTFNQLNPTAAALLRLTAYLAPDPIPLDMFEEGASIVEEAVGLVLEETGQEDSPETVLEGLAELAAYSMLVKDGETGTVHRMVQEVIRGRIPGERRREWIERALRLMNDFSPLGSDDIRTWHVWDLLRPHVAFLVVIADQLGIAEPTARLMNELSILLKEKGLFREAEPLVQRALEINEANSTANVSACINNLAQLLQDMNRLAEAEPLMRRALKIDEDSFGQDHPNVARDLSNLASLLQATNRLAEAEPLIRRALKIDEDSFGQNHPNVAIRLNNLAALLQTTNRLAEAEPLMRQALKICENSLGARHPNVARCLTNLAALLQATNRSAEAEPLMRRALKIDEESFGQNHPEVTIDLNNLAQLLQATDRLAEAEPLMRRALKIDEDSFGQNHPNVAIDLNNLGGLLQATNRLAEAEPLMRRAVEILEASLGPDHPNSLRARKNLERLLAAMKPSD